MKKMTSLLISASLLSTSALSTEAAYDYDEYEDLNPLEYSYQYSEGGKTDFRGYYRQHQADPNDDAAGCCYFNSCRAAQLTVGAAVGAAMVIAIIAVVSKDGRSAHCH